MRRYRQTGAAIRGAALLCVLALLPATFAPALAKGNFAGQTARTLRYRPDGTDFVSSICLWTTTRSCGR